MTNTADLLSDLGGGERVQKSAFGLGFCTVHVAVRWLEGQEEEMGFTHHAEEDGKICNAP